MLKPPVTLNLGVADDAAHDATYRWNNQRRADRAPAQVAQFTRRGQGRFAMGGREYAVNPGDLMLFTLNEESEYWFPRDSESPWEFTWINFTGLEVLWALIREEHGSVVHLGLKSRASTLLRRCAEHFSQAQLRDEWEESVSVYQFVIAVAREATESRRESTADLDRARHLLFQAGGGPIGVKEVAARFGYSREHFTRLFAERFGEAPGSLLRAGRLRHARTLLSQSGMKLERIAELSGFGSSAALCRAFRQATGVSPGVWRREVG